MSPSSPATIKTRLLLLSDTHNHPGFPQNTPSTSTPYPYRLPLPRCDILLHAGDITMSGRLSEYQRIFSTLADADAELKIVIAGNHDITLDEEYYAAYGGQARHGERREDLRAVRELWSGEEARRKGVVYLEEGVRRFVLKNGVGFTIYTSPYQPEFCYWAFSYRRDQDRYNISTPITPFQAPNPVPNWPHIDLMLTHGPPYGILDETMRGEDVGCENLLRAVQRCRPRVHCFGHIHEGWGAERVLWDEERRERVEVDAGRVLEERAAGVDVSSCGERPLVFGKETLFVNASIMNVRYQPVNAPWVVDLDLPLANADERDEPNFAVFAI